MEAVREEKIGAGSVVGTFAVALSLAGLACALTLVFLSSRSVMNVGGFCAEGGAYNIRPALFLSLGWNFFEYAFDPTPPMHGLIWSWLLCGVIFVLMGGIPLFATLPAIIREFQRGEPQQHDFPAGVPVVHAKRVARRFGLAPTGDRLVTDLERLDSLLQSGALTQEEYARAKRRLLGDT